MRLPECRAGWIVLTEQGKVVPGTRESLGRVIRSLVQHVHYRAAKIRRLAVQAHELGAGTVRIIEIPRVGRVAACLPGVGYCRCKVPRPVHAPVAHGVEHRTAGGIEGFSHGVVTVIAEFRSPFLALIVAIVVFDIVDLVLQLAYT